MWNTLSDFTWNFNLHEWIIDVEKIWLSDIRKIIVIVGLYFLSYKRPHNYQFYFTVLCIVKNGLPISWSEQQLQLFQERLFFTAIFALFSPRSITIFNFRRPRRRREKIRNFENQCLPKNWHIRVKFSSG